MSKTVKGPKIVTVDATYVPVTKDRPLFGKAQPVCPRCFSRPNVRLGGTRKRAAGDLKGLYVTLYPCANTDCPTLLRIYTTTNLQSEIPTFVDAARLARYCAGHTTDRGVWMSPEGRAIIPPVPGRAARITAVKKSDGQLSLDLMVTVPIEVLDVPAAPAD